MRQKNLRITTFEQCTWSYPFGYMDIERSIALAPLSSFAAWRAAIHHSHDQQMALYSPTARPKRERWRIPTHWQLLSAPAELRHTLVYYKESWSTEENKALLLFQGDPPVWPSFSKKSKFWQKDAVLIQRRSSSTFQRSGKQRQLPSYILWALNYMYYNNCINYYYWYLFWLPRWRRRDVPNDYGTG